MQVRNTRCISPLIRTIRYHGQQGLEELHGNTVAWLACNVAFLGRRLYFCEEIDLLLQVSTSSVSQKFKKQDHNIACKLWPQGCIINISIV